VFPPGYPVAEVTKVEHAATATFAKVEARPTAHLDRAREVLLVWFRPPVPAESEGSAAAAAEPPAGPASGSPPAPEPRE
jgi:rod shape-determining protein MreC